MLSAGVLQSRLRFDDRATALAAIGASALLAILIVGGFSTAHAAHLLALGIAASVLVLITLRWLLAATVVFLVVTFPVSLPPSLGAGASIAKPFGVLLACSVALRFFRERDRPILFRERPVLGVFLVCYFAWAALSLLWSNSSGNTQYDVKRLFQAVLLAVVLYAVARTRRDVLVLMAGMVAASVIWSTYALATGTAIAGGRLTGGVNDPNYLAAELVLCIILGAYLTGATRRASLRLLLAAAVTIDLVAFVLTQSRGGIIGLAVGVAIAIAVAGPARIVAIALTALLLAGAVGYVGIVAPAHIRHRITDFSTSHTSGRKDSWQIAWKIFENHPFQGVALGGFRDEQLKYVSSGIDVQFVGQILNSRLVVHNTYLETLAELGLIGFALFGGILLGALGAGLRALPRIGLAEGYAVRGLVAGTVGMLAAFFFVSAEYEKPLWVAVTLLAAAPSRFRPPGRPTEEPLEALPARRAASGPS